MAHFFVPREVGSAGPRRALLASLPEQPLHHQDVLPLAVEAAVAAMDADLAPAPGADQGDAGLVRGEDLPDQLVVAAELGLLGQGLEERPAGPAAARIPAHVERRLTHAGVVLVGVVVGTDARPADHPPIPLGDQHQSATLDLGSDLSPVL